MNNDLNNMAKRYKDEMMRLYRQSNSAGKNQQSSGIMGMGAGMSGNAPNGQMSRSASDRMAVQAQDYADSMAAQNTDMQRNAAGTPVPNVPGASFYGNSGGCMGVNSGMSAANSDMTGNSANVNVSGSGTMGNVPVNTAENMSGCQSSVTVPINVPVDCECRFPTAESIIGSINSGGALIEPHSEVMHTPQPAAYSNNSVQTASVQRSVMPAADSVNDASAANSDSETALRSFIINSFPLNADYTANDPGEATGEIFPDFALPADLSADAQGEVPSTARFFPSIGWITLTGDNGWGFLQVEVFDERGMPVQGAFVVIKKIVGNSVRLMRFLYTNRNGLTPTIALPAPLIMTLTAQSTTPFSVYSITVRARGFMTMRNIQVPIYAGSKLVQPVEMKSIYPDSLIQPRSGNDVG